MKSDIIESRKIFVLMFKTPIKGNTEITNNKNKNKNKTELFSIQVGGGILEGGKWQIHCHIGGISNSGLLQCACIIYFPEISSGYSIHSGKA